MKKASCFECGKEVYTVRWYPNYLIICDDCELDEVANQIVEE